MEIRQTVEFRVPVREVYLLWRDNYERFAEMLDNVKEVRKIDDKRSRWRLRGPMESELQFVSEITRFEENRLVEWRTTEGDLPHRGQVRFTEQGGQSTLVDFVLDVQPPGGQLGEKLAQMGEMFEKEYVENELLKIKSQLEGRVGAVR